MHLTSTWVSDIDIEGESNGNNDDLNHSWHLLSSQCVLDMVWWTLHTLFILIITQPCEVAALGPILQVKKQAQRI